MVRDETGDRIFHIFIKHGGLNLFKPCASESIVVFRKLNFYDRADQFIFAK